MLCELCNKKTAIYNVQVRPLQEPVPGDVLRGKSGAPSMGGVVVNLVVCKKCLPFSRTVFKVGDMVEAKGDVKFMDGTEHKGGERYRVTGESEAYFNMCHRAYKKVV